MKNVIKKIFYGFLTGLGCCLACFTVDKIFKPKIDMEFKFKKEDES